MSGSASSDALLWAQLIGVALLLLLSLLCGYVSSRTPISAQSQQHALRSGASQCMDDLRDGLVQRWSLPRRRFFILHMAAVLALCLASLAPIVSPLPDEHPLRSLIAPILMLLVAMQRLARALYDLSGLPTVFKLVRLLARMLCVAGCAVSKTCCCCGGGRRQRLQPTSPSKEVSL